MAIQARFQTMKIGLVVLAMALGGSVIFVYAGVYNIAADAPHFGFIARIIDVLRDRSIAVRATSISTPGDLADSKRIAAGAGLYGEMCSGCHLAPGMERTEISQGLYPRAPELAKGSDLSPVALVAPHRGADRHTGTIVQLLMAEHRFGAAAWNSAPRRASAACPHAGDVAREPTHYITAFSLAFAHQYPRGRIVQIHGFDGKNRQSLDAGKADFILGDGTANPPRILRDVADCLIREFPDRPVRVYGIDSDELGATTNRQGRALRRAGFAGFTHIEMSPGMREQLVGDRAVRARFAACLEAGL